MTGNPLVYGLALHNMPPNAAKLCGVSTCDAPAVRLEQLVRDGAAVDGETHIRADEMDLRVDDCSAILRLAEGWLEVERGPRSVIRYHLSRPLSDEAPVHPYLAFPAAVVSHWLGRVALHAGAMIVDGSAIAILGTKGAGKSSTMAAAARAGFEVLCDDLLVLDGSDALAGPRAIDLRADAAETFGGRYLGMVGARERWRIPIGPCRASAPLLAIVTLGWADTIKARPLAASERIGPLMESCALGSGWLAPSAAFELFEIPAWEVVRPRDLGAIDAFVKTIAALVTG